MSEGKFPHRLDVYGMHPHAVKTLAILSYRLWVVWERDRKLAYILLIIFSVLWVACLVAVTKSVALTSLMPYSGFLGRGCLIVKSSRITWIDWLLVLLYNTGEAAFRFLADDI